MAFINAASKKIHDTIAMPLRLGLSLTKEVARQLCLPKRPVHNVARGQHRGSDEHVALAGVSPQGAKLMVETDHSGGKPGSAGPLTPESSSQGSKSSDTHEEKPRIMRSAEARTGGDEPEDKPGGGLENVPEYPPDRYKRVKTAESFAKNVLQIPEVTFRKDVRIANTVNRAILSLAKRNVPVPYGALVYPDQFQGEAENWLACYELLLANEDGTGRIYINPTHAEWDSDQAMKRRRGQFSTGSRYHAIVHEMAELAYHQTIGTERFREGTRENRFDEHLFLNRIKKKHEEIREAVSEYALKNHTEFICEVFTALMLGRDELRDNKRVMEIYHELEGPRQFEDE